MRKILFTSSFKSIPVAFLIAIAAILFIENYGRTYFTQTFFNHEVDHLLQKVETSSFDSDYLLLGDSVAKQLCSQFSRDPQFAVLAANQTIEITGQLFLTKRYLETNKNPKAVIFIGLPFFYRNLEQIFTENFVLRTFTHFDEIWEVFKVKRDPSIATKMLTYKAFPSYKYRLKLQDRLIGFTNSDIYSGVDELSKKSIVGEYAITEVFKSILQNETTSYVHFIELLDYLDKQEIQFYYIPAPIKKLKMNKQSGNFKQHQKLIGYQLPPIKEKYPQFYYFEKQIQHPKQFFIDPAHYNQTGLPHGERYMKDRIYDILEFMKGGPAPLSLL